MERGNQATTRKKQKKDTSQERSKETGREKKRSLPLVLALHRLLNLVLRYRHFPWRSDQSDLLNIQTEQKKQRMCTTNQSAVDGARDGEREPIGGVADAQVLPLVDAVVSGIGMEPESCR